MLLYYLDFQIQQLKQKYVEKGIKIILELIDYWIELIQLLDQSYWNHLQRKQQDHFSLVYQVVRFLTLVCHSLRLHILDIKIIVKDQVNELQNQVQFK